MALDAMDNWKKLAEQGRRLVLSTHKCPLSLSCLPGSHSDLRHDAKLWRAPLQKAYEAVEASVKPMLHGWLQYPKDGRYLLCVL